MGLAQGICSAPKNCCCPCDDCPVYPLTPLAKFLSDEEIIKLRNHIQAIEDMGAKQKLFDLIDALAALRPAMFTTF